MAAMRDASMNTNMHLAFKREIARLDKALQVTDLSDGGRCAGLAARYKFFSDTLHHHHQGEDTYLFPTVRASASPDEVQTLDDMEREHAELVEVLARLDGAFSRLGPGSDVPAMSDDLQTLLRVLTAHCAHEERDGVPIVQKYLSDDNYKAFMKFNRSAPTAALVMPWMCDGAPADIAAQTWGVIPAPVRLFLKPSMTRKYTKFSAECGV